MRALSIRQPFVELILRGVKTIEWRSRPTRLVGQRFYLYASQGRGTKVAGGVSLPGATADPTLPQVWSEDLSIPTAHALPPWMWELAQALVLPEDSMPRGVIVGTARIERVAYNERFNVFGWHLKDVQRLKRAIKPRGHPQPVWFEPFPSDN